MSPVSATADYHRKNEWIIIVQSRSEQQDPGRVCDDDHDDDDDGEHLVPTAAADLAMTDAVVTVLVLAEATGMVRLGFGVFGAMGHYQKDCPGM
jgi:hypothetical protein